MYDLELTFTQKEYKDYFLEFCRIVRCNMPETTESFIKESLEKQGYLKNENKKDVYFEIGPGEGKLVNLIGNHFNKQVVCEMNHDFAENLRKQKDVTVIEDSIFKISENQIPKFDLAIAAHVFYYFSKEEILEFYNRLSVKRNSNESRIVTMFGGFGIEQKEFFVVLLNEYFAKLNKILAEHGKDQIDFKNNKSIFKTILSEDYVDSILVDSNHKKVCFDTYKIEFKLINLQEGVVFYTFYLADGILDLPKLMNLIKDSVELNLIQLQEILSGSIEEYLSKNLNFPCDLYHFENLYIV